MRPISITLDEYVRAGNLLDIHAVLTLADETSIDLPKTAFSSVSFEGGTSSSGKFEIGGAIIGTFSFVLNNFDDEYTDIDYAGATIIPYIGVGADEVQVGEYWLVRHRFAGNFVNCEAYDGLKVLDKFPTDVTWPCTALALAQRIADRHGWDLVGDFANSSTILPDPGETLTERMALSYMGAVTGNYIRMNYLGQLCISWYGDTDDIEIDTTMGSPSIDIADTEVTGVAYGDDVFGGSDYVIHLDNNPFVNDANKLTIMNSLLARVQGLTFRAGDVNILSHPAIEAGDRITVPGQDGNAISMLVTTWRYKLGLSETIVCDAETEEEKDLRPRTKGDKGDTLYTWIVYADDALGTGITTNPSGKDFMGVAANRATPTPNLQDPTAYSWSKVVGADGNTYYTWVAYADDEEGTGISLNPNGKEYLGLAYNQPDPIVDISEPSIFDWALIMGSSGQDGAPGPEAVVIVYASEIDWDEGTATLHALLRVNGAVATPTHYAWTKTVGGTHTAVGTDSANLVVTAAMGLDALYSCTVEW